MRNDICRGSEKRALDQTRDIQFEVGYVENAHGSCFVKIGKTWVVCTATIEDRVPFFLKNTGRGWITAEYSMLPSATHTRTQRDSTRNLPNGRSQEIQRLIGRSLRAVADLRTLGERQIIVDCDVIQADGGTRTAAINGGYLAVCAALENAPVAASIRKKGGFTAVMKKHVSAISCGILNGVGMLDLTFREDEAAEVDANFVLDSTDCFVEIQCSAEKRNFTREEMLKMMDLVSSGCGVILEKQTAALERFCGNKTD